MQTSVETETEREVVRFLTRQPSPEAILAFHPSSATTERLYELIDAERERSLTEDERRELDTYPYLEHLLRMLKIEVRRQLEQRAP